MYTENMYLDVFINNSSDLDIKGSCKVVNEDNFVIILYRSHGIYSSEYFRLRIITFHKD